MRILIIGRNWYALTLCCQDLHQVSPRVGGVLDAKGAGVCKKAVASSAPADPNNMCDLRTFKARRLLPSCSGTQSWSPPK
ncbi:unnamed protein product [Ixodes persulcatus]